MGPGTLLVSGGSWHDKGGGDWCGAIFDRVIVRTLCRNAAHLFRSRKREYTASLNTVHVCVCVCVCLGVCVYMCVLSEAIYTHTQKYSEHIRTNALHASWSR